MKNNNNPFKKEDKFTNKFNSQSQNQNLSFKDPHKKNFKYDPTNNSFSQSNSKQKLNKDNSIKETPIELNNTNLFPDLVPIKTNTQPNIECNKFKHILTNIPINRESPKTHIIPHGCLEITRVLQKYVYEYGTTSFIQKKEEEEDLDYIMNNTIEIMTKKWDKYENDYDNIHGEGFYANKFRLPSQDYETDSEEQNNSEEYNSDEHNSDEYYYSNE
jgi:hypothetical protein